MQRRGRSRREFFDIDHGLSIVGWVLAGQQSPTRLAAHRMCCGIVSVVEFAWHESGAGSVCADLLATVPHWFGMPDANETYRQIADRHPTLVASEGDQHIGFLTLLRHSPHAAEIHVMAVRPAHHRNGVGRRLVGVAEDRLRAEGCEFLQVKTLSAAANDDGYLKTLAFYEALGFRVLEEMPHLWDRTNPAVLLIKYL